MDFFEAQARAKQRTSRLLGLFVLAVLGTNLAGYGAALLIAGRGLGRMALWQPGLFLAVTAGTLLVVGLASLAKWSQFSAGGSAVAESVGGRRVDPHTIDLNERRLLNVVEEMAIASGVAMPAVYLLEDEPGINAFAAGLTTGDAVVAVTRGTLEKLTRDELQGVVGHEFSHILNGDMRLNVKLTAIVFGILVIGLAGRGILQTLGRGRIRFGGGKNKGGAVAGILAVGVALMVVGYVGYFFGRLIQAAVSRQREFLADASSVQFTRNPEGLTGALKKIGGHALGSAMQSSQSTALGHFFFAQGFQSMFGGAWATHPPLEERIRAIDPRFDGRFTEPPEVVDAASEPWARPGRPRDAAGFAPGALPARPTPAAAVQAIGLLTPETVAHAQDLLAGLPAPLLEAARQPQAARLLLYGLLLDADPAVRGRQAGLVAQHDGAPAAADLARLTPALSGLRPEQKLPLLQLALPALRQLPAEQTGTFFGTLDELVHADGRVTVFEFALQKVLLRHLAPSGRPAVQVVQIHSFQAVAQEIGLVLSVLARTAHPAEGAEAAFAAGASQLRLLDERLALLPAGQDGLDRLEAALDRLATASGPIKLRLLTAAAHVVAADGMIAPTEAELLRAIAAALDVPMPPLGAAPA